MIPQPGALAPTALDAEGVVRRRWRERRVLGRPAPAQGGGAARWVMQAAPVPAAAATDLHRVAVLTTLDVIARHHGMNGTVAETVTGWDGHRPDSAGSTRPQDAITGAAGTALRLEDRLGCDPAVQTFATADPEYVDSVWWAVTQLWEADLLRQRTEVTRRCPRCADVRVVEETSPASVERAIVRFPVYTAGQLRTAGASLLVTVEDPASLPDVATVAVSPDDYVLAQAPGDSYPVVVARTAVGGLLGDGVTVHRDVPVDELHGLSCRHPLAAVHGRGDDEVAIVVMPSSTDGVHPVPDDGERPATGGGAGDIRDDATAPRDPTIAGRPLDGHVVVADLRERGLLLRTFPAQRGADACARCEVPLTPVTRTEWIVSTTGWREQLAAAHDGVVRHGSVSDIPRWALGETDWGVTTSRAQVVPLPLWRCSGCGEVTAVDSRSRLSALTGRDLRDVDPRDGAVTDASFTCRRCGSGGTRREPVWLDNAFVAGTMPFARFGFPGIEGSNTRFARNHAADLVVEGVHRAADATLTIAVLLWGASSHGAVLVVGGADDASPTHHAVTLCARHGADAVRWAALTTADRATASSGPEASGRSAVDAVIAPLRQACVAALAATGAAGLPHADAVRAPAVETREAWDRWLLAELAATVDDVRRSLHAYDLGSATTSLHRAVGWLTAWRRQRCPSTTGDDVALATLHEFLVTIAALLAPFMPFLAEELYEALVRAGSPATPDSVHLLRYPTADPKARDDALRHRMRQRLRTSTDRDRTHATRRDPVAAR